MKKIWISLVAMAFVASASYADNKKEVDRVENSGTVITEILNIPDNIPGPAGQGRVCRRIAVRRKIRHRHWRQLWPRCHDLPQWREIQWAVGRAYHDRT